MPDAAMPEAVRQWLAERQAARAARDFATADRLRAQIEAAGYLLKDTATGPELLPRGEAPPAPALKRYSGPAAVPSCLDEPSTIAFSVNILVDDDAQGVERAVAGALRHAGTHGVEVVLVDNGVRDPAAVAAIDALAARPGVRALRLASNVGAGAGRNVGLKQSCGSICVLLDLSVEPVGDFYSPLAATLADPTVGLTGGWGLTTPDLRHYHESRGPAVDAIEAYCLAFRRADLGRVGWLDEKYRFYRNLDLDYSLAFRAQGYRLVVTPDLPLIRHEHVWHRLDPQARERLSRKNFYHFLDKWRNRTDLLLHYDPDAGHHPDREHGDDPDHAHEA